MEEELIGQKRAEQNPSNVTSVQLQGALQMENHLLGIHRALERKKPEQDICFVCEKCSLT